MSEGKSCRKIPTYRGQALFKKINVVNVLRKEIEMKNNNPFMANLEYDGPTDRRPVRQRLFDPNHTNDPKCTCVSNNCDSYEIKDKNGVIIKNRYGNNTHYIPARIITHECKCQYYYLTNTEFKRIMNRFNDKHQIYGQWIFKKIGPAYYLFLIDS